MQGIGAYEGETCGLGKNFVVVRGLVCGEGWVMACREGLRDWNRGLKYISDTFFQAKDRGNMWHSRFN